MRTPDTDQSAWQCTAVRCGRLALTGCGITLLLLLLFWSATILAVIFIF